MGVLDLGPFPRQGLRYDLTPIDVFESGIPGIEGTEWLQANAEVTGFLLDMSTPALGPTEVHGIVDLCGTIDDNDPISGTTDEILTYAGSGVIRCPVRVSAGARKQWIDDARVQLLNYVLDGAISTHAAAGTTVGTTNWLGALIGAEEHLNRQYVFRGNIGVPVAALNDLAERLHYDGSAVWSPAGHRVWLHYDTSTADGLIATSQVFYASVTEEHEAFEQAGNVEVQKLTTYAKVVYDLPSAVFGPAE